MNNKPADCSVYLDSDNTISAEAQFECSEEDLGIAGGSVRFSGLTYGKNYVIMYLTGSDWMCKRTAQRSESLIQRTVVERFIIYHYWKLTQESRLVY